MKLYFSPLACSLATRIALYEAGAIAEFVQVDAKRKLTAHGEPFLAINGLGLVPTIETDSGERLSENAAVLQFVARRYPKAELAPTDPAGVARLQQWLCFIGTELHRAVYAPLLDPSAHAEVKAYALRNVDSRFGWLAEQLAGREYLLERFSVADAYLYAVLNWSLVAPVDLKRWPSIVEYQRRVRERPNVARAFAEELELYRREVA